MQLRGRVKFLEGMRFLASGDSGHGVIVDSSDNAGEMLAPSPMELVILAAGCCTGMDILHILRRMSQPPTDLEVEVVAERSEEDPKVLQSINFNYRLTGEGIAEESIQRAIRLSHERYCSVGVMLHRAGVEISTNLEIKDMQE